MRRSIALLAGFAGLGLLSGVVARAAVACQSPAADWDLKSKGLPGFSVHAEPERFAESDWPKLLKPHAPYSSVEVRTPDGTSVTILRSLRDPALAYARLPDGAFENLPQDAVAAKVGKDAVAAEVGRPATAPTASATVAIESRAATSEMGTEALAPIFEMGNRGLFRHDILFRDPAGRLAAAIEVDECFPFGIRRNLAEYDGSRECGVTIFSLVHPAAAADLGALKEQVRTITRRERGIHIARVDQIITDLTRSYASAPEDYYKALMAQGRLRKTYAPWKNRFPKKGARHSAIELRATDRTGAKEPYLGRIDPGTWLVVAVSHGTPAPASAGNHGSGPFCHGFVIPVPEPTTGAAAGSGDASPVTASYRTE